MNILLKFGTENKPESFKEIKTNTKPDTIENKIIIPFIFGLIASTCPNASI